MNFSFRGTPYYGTYLHTSAHEREDSVYFSHFTHGTLHYEQGHSTTIDRKYGGLATQYREAGWRIVLYIPKRVEYECPRHQGMYTVYGVPCAAITMQHERPEIPRDWDGHWTEYAREHDL